MANATDQITTIFDADNHYWETSDAFTRYRDPKFAERGVQVKEVDGVLRYVLDGEVFAVLPGPGDVHPRPKPGVVHGLLRREARPDRSSWRRSTSRRRSTPSGTSVTRA